MEKNTHTYNINDETEVQDNRGNLDEKNEQNIRFFFMDVENRKFDLVPIHALFTSVFHSPFA